MDKQERKLKGKYKFIKRLKKYGSKAVDAFKENHNLWVFKTTLNFWHTPSDYSRTPRGARPPGWEPLF
jgi:hypothetical protein